MKNGVQYGLMGGIASIILSLVLYLIDPNLFFNSYVAIFGIIVYSTFMVLAGLAERKALGGGIDFRQALGTTFITFVIIAFLSSVFTYVLYNFIEPNMAQLAKEYSIDATNSIFEWMGNVPEEQVEEAMQEIENQDFSMTFATSFMNFTIAISMGMVLALIISAIIKRRPEESNVNFD